MKTLFFDFVRLDQVAIKREDFTARLIMTWVGQWDSVGSVVDRLFVGRSLASARLDPMMSVSIRHGQDHRLDGRLCDVVVSATVEKSVKIQVSTRLSVPREAVVALGITDKIREVIDDTDTDTGTITPAELTRWVNRVGESAMLVIEVEDAAQAELPLDDEDDEDGEFAV